MYMMRVLSIFVFLSLPSLWAQTPAPFVPLSEFGTGYTYNVAIKDHYVFMAADEDGLVVLDISSPNQPREVANLLLENQATALSIAGNVLAVIHGGLTSLVDISKPAQPVILADKFALGQSILYLTDELLATYDAFSDVLSLWDYLSGGSPTLIGQVEAAGIQAMRISGSTLYTVDGDSFLRAWNIENPESITELGNILVSDFRLGGLEVFNDTVYVFKDSAGTPNVFAIDVSDPSQMQICFQDSFATSFREIRLVGDQLILFAGSRIVIYNVNDGCNLTYSKVRAVENAPWRRFVATATHIFCATDTELEIWDYSGDIFKSGTYGEFFLVNGLAKSGSSLFLATGTLGLNIFDVEDPSNPFLIYQGNHDITYSAIPWNNHLYVNRPQTPQLVIYDISDPSSPNEIGSLELQSIFQTLVTDQYLFLRAFDRLEIYSLANPGEPGLLSSQTEFSNFSSLSAKDDLLIGYRNQSLVIMRTDEQGQLTPLFEENSHWFNHTEIEGDRLYVGNSVLGLQIYDISNPASPQLLNTIEDLVSPFNMTVNRGILAFSGNERVVIVDLNDPLNPIYLAAQQSLSAQGGGLVVDGDYVFKTQGRLRIFGQGCIQPAESAARFASWPIAGEVSVLDLIHAFPCESGDSLP
jgi:hypothetical protein